LRLKGLRRVGRRADTGPGGQRGWLCVTRHGCRRQQGSRRLSLTTNTQLWRQERKFFRTTGSFGTARGAGERAQPALDTGETHAPTPPNSNNNPSTPSKQGTGRQAHDGWQGLFTIRRWGRGSDGSGVARTSRRSPPRAEDPPSLQLHRALNLQMNDFCMHRESPRPKVLAEKIKPVECGGEIPPC
jgi:hypothetical protein